MIPTLPTKYPVCYAVALIAWGIQHLIYGVLIAGRTPLWPQSLPGQVPVAYVTGAFILTGAAIIFQKQAKVASAVAGLLILFWAGLRNIIEVAITLDYGGLLTNTGKALSIGFGGLLVPKTFVSGQGAGKNDEWIVRFGSFARYALGLFLLISSVQHFIFIDFVKFLVPTWVPGAIFWTYLAGVALIAASLGLLTGIKAKLAASLSGWMIFIWWMVLHIPRAVTSWSDGNEWTAVFEAISMSGLLFFVGNEISSKED